MRRGSPPGERSEPSHRDHHRADSARGDGLAMSSRNRYLGDDERRRALANSRGLFAAEANFVQRREARSGRCLKEVDWLQSLRGSLRRGLRRFDPADRQRDPEAMGAAHRVGIGFNLAISAPR